MQENRGEERQRGRGGEREKPVSAYDLICANEDAAGSGC